MELNSLVENFKQDLYSRVLILSGAGVSTSAGIPDYRSGRKLGTESELIKFIQEAQPTASHHLAKWLEDQGKLQRVITQNIDGLYSSAGVSPFRGRRSLSRSPPLRK